MGTERGRPEPLTQADLFNDELPPSVPDRQTPTPEEIETWMAQLPF